MSTAVLGPQTEQSRRTYRAVWRWHFYAGVFCIPLVIWLACTGSIYLFEPQIERWLDRPYDHLNMSGQPATPEQIAIAAMHAVPGSSLHYYELAPSTSAATRVIVGVGKEEYCVYAADDRFRASWSLKKAQVPLAGLGLEERVVLRGESEGGAQGKLQDARIKC